MKVEKIVRDIASYAKIIFAAISVSMIFPCIAFAGALENDSISIRKYIALNAIILCVAILSFVLHKLCAIVEERTSDQIRMHFRRKRHIERKRKMLAKQSEDTP